MARAYLRTISFWVSFAFGWVVMACILSVILGFVEPPHGFSGLKLVAILVGVHSLWAAAGFSYARAHVRRLDPHGFPVVPKADDESRAR
jgi:hypothetical protein